MKEAAAAGPHRVAEVWAGRLEPHEARLVGQLARILKSLLAVCAAALGVGITAAVLGLPEEVAGVIGAATITYGIGAAWYWSIINRRAQRLVGTRLGIPVLTTRKIDFRGFARFDASIKQAHGADSR